MSEKFYYKLRFFFENRFNFQLSRILQKKKLIILNNLFLSPFTLNPEFLKIKILKENIINLRNEISLVNKYYNLYEHVRFRKQTLAYHLHSDYCLLLEDLNLLTESFCLYLK